MDTCEMERVTMRCKSCGGVGEMNVVVVSITEKGWFWHFASFTSIATDHILTADHVKMAERY